MKAREVLSIVYQIATVALWLSLMVIGACRVYRAAFAEVVQTVQCESQNR